MVGYIGPKAIQYNVDNSVVEGDSSIGGDLYLSGSAYTSVVQGLGDEAGLTFGGDTIAPRKNNAPADGTVDLGAADASFKDLHLSGGVYLGGTGSANKLDEYETGTWTPTNAGCTFNLYDSVYTRIGRLVNCSAYVETTSTGSIETWYGLPFAAAYSGSSSNGGFVFYQNVATSATWTVLLLGAEGFTFRQGITAQSNFPTNKNIRFNIIYNTDE